MLLDGLMVGLLISAIIFCWRLNARLQKMRQMGQELTPFMKNMAAYVTQISQTIDKLKHKLLNQINMFLLFKLSI
jgi:hypothetical protein